MPRVKCCINNCSCNIRNCTLYNFPRPQRLAERWITLVEPYYPGVIHVPKNKLRLVKICKHHFELKYFEGIHKKRISYPTLFTSDEISRSCPASEISFQCEHGQLDHPDCSKEKIFILPTKRTLKRFTRELKLQAGINHNVLNQIKEESKDWAPTKKICSILFDEVTISSLIAYNESEDSIDGFVDMGKIKQQKFCDHALVFMLRGLCTNWKQQIAFYFVEGSVTPLELKTIIRDVVNATVGIGLTPMTLICDQGTTFQACFKNMLEDTRRDQKGELYEDHAVIINGHRLLMIFDPPHLIKGIRNNLLTKDMIFQGKTARWSDILEVYKADCQLGNIRLLHKLTDEHVIPHKIRKMKVRNCTQVLSERTSAMLKYTSRFDKLRRLPVIQVFLSVRLHLYR